MNRPLLALDFDGVLCDSRPECAIVSANAWLALRNPAHAPLFRPEVMPEAAFASFMQFRYLVRTAPQYLLLWELAAAGADIHPALPLERQTPADPGRMEAFRLLFFALRGRWRADDPDGWLARNPLYPAVAACLPDLRAVPDLHIVSAKDESSIRAILGRNDLHLAPGAVMGGDHGDKRDLMAALCARFPGRPVLFVDDNPENLVLADMPGVRCLLADWGYHGPDFAARTRAAGYGTVSPATFAELVREARP